MFKRREDKGGLKVRVLTLGSPTDVKNALEAMKKQKAEKEN